ncbi:MAG: hypothetical protein U1E78_04880 [Gammaproteobacteria bacterium]
MIFRVGAERSRRRSVHKVHDCDENREGNNPENSAVKGIDEKEVNRAVEDGIRSGRLDKSIISSEIQLHELLRGLGLALNGTITNPAVVLSTAQDMKLKEILRQLSDKPAERILRDDLASLREKGFIESKGSTKTMLWPMKK